MDDCLFNRLIMTMKASRIATYRQKTPETVFRLLQLAYADNLGLLITEI